MAHKILIWVLSGILVWNCIVGMLRSVKKNSHAGPLLWELFWVGVEFYDQTKWVTIQMAHRKFPKEQLIIRSRTQGIKITSTTYLTQSVHWLSDRESLNYPVHHEYMHAAEVRVENHVTRNTDYSCWHHRQQMSGLPTRWPADSVSHYLTARKHWGVRRCEMQHYNDKSQQSHLLFMINLYVLRLSHWYNRVDIMCTY